MVRTLILCTFVLAAACGSDASPPDAPAAAIDAPAGAVDAPTSTPDAAAGRTCTGAAYDPCNDASQCTSGNCKLFMSAGLMVCTQACSAQNPCPQQNGADVPCNNMGICRPAAATTCTP